jgi:hypothetical protein
MSELAYNNELLFVLFLKKKLESEGEGHARSQLKIPYSDVNEDQNPI